MSKKVKNNITPKSVGVTAGDINSELYKNRNLVVDFSFEGAFVSCTCGDFSNLLLDQNDFIKHFRGILDSVIVLSTHKPSYVFSGAFRHCHKLSDVKANEVAKIAQTVLRNMDKPKNFYEQLLGGEDLYQIGLYEDNRLFGTLQGNVFRVYVIDYFHDLYFDERRNERNRQQCKFCPKTADIC